ncbi:MAG: membrane protein insertion efficiency factor YidD [Cyanobacteria bacterium P01_H01_bin.130]
MFDRQTMGLSKGVSKRSPRSHPKQHHFARYGAVLDRLFRRILIRSIGFYQRRLSPYKGFSCAYRVLHRTHSCSQATQEILRDHSLVEALPRIRHQFCQCRDAMHVIRDRRSQMATQSPRCRRRLAPNATPHSLLFPTLSDRVLMTQTVMAQTGGGDGYEESRRDRKRRNTDPGQPYRSDCCDIQGSVCFCGGDSTNQTDCCDCLETCDGCMSGCDGCPADCG